MIERQSPVRLLREGQVPVAARQLKALASKGQSLRVVDPEILIHRLAQTFGHSASLRFGLTTTAAPNLMAVSRRSFSDSLTMRAPKT